MSKYASSLPERGPELQAPLSRVRETERREEERALPVVHLCARQYAFEPVAPGWRGRGERPTPLKRARRCDTVRLALLLASSPDIRVRFHRYSTFYCRSNLPPIASDTFSVK